MALANNEPKDRAPPERLRPFHKVSIQPSQREQHFMLRIGQRQLEAMAQAKEGVFHQMLLKQLRIDYPEQTRNKSDETLLQEIQQIHLRAKSYGILENPSLCQFIYLSVAFEPRFYEDPHVDQYLKEKPANAAERFLMLLEVIVRQLSQARI